MQIAQALAELGDGTLVVGPPKSTAGRRVVTIRPHIVPVLREHLERYVEDRPDAAVFSGASGGRLRRPRFAQEFKKAREATGIECHFHDLRHAGATWAAQAGGTTAELTARLGHASPAAALRYQHATSARDRALARALSELVSDGKPAASEAGS